MQSGGRHAPALRCPHCRAPCGPTPRVQAQRCCAHPACQRARKTPWQRDTLARDPDSRAPQRDCQRHWQHPQPQYWREYRQRRAASRTAPAVAPAPGPHTPCPSAGTAGRVRISPLHGPRDVSSPPRRGGAPGKAGRVIAALAWAAQHLGVAAHNATRPGPQTSRK